MKECDCEYCPLSWEERGLEDGDAGCFWYGDLYGSRFMCHMPNFIKWFIANIRIRKNEKELSKQYEGIGEWYEEVERKNCAMQQALNEKLLENRWGEKLYLCTESDGKLYKYNDGVISDEEAGFVRWRYEELLENSQESIVRNKN